MKSRRINDWIAFGAAIRYLQDARAGFFFHRTSYVNDNINRVLDYLTEFNMVVTKRAAGELIAFQKEFVNAPEDYRFTAAEASRLSKLMKDLRLTLSAEAKGFFAYIVTDKRFATEKLLDRISTLFAPNTFDKCPDIARYDFEEAGKCIAFERSTAAAFHLLRGTEAVLRLYYKKFIRPAIPNQSWGQMTTALHAKKTGNKPDVVVLNNLDNVRRSFRNPTQHPDKIYDIQEAQDLFSLCVDLVNRMVKVLT